MNCCEGLIESLPNLSSCEVSTASTESTKFACEVTTRHNGWLSRNKKFTYCTATGKKKE